MLCDESRTPTEMDGALKGVFPKSEISGDIKKSY